MTDKTSIPGKLTWRGDSDNSPALSHVHADAITGKEPELSGARINAVLSNFQHPTFQADGELDEIIATIRSPNEDGLHNVSFVPDHPITLDSGTTYYLDLEHPVLSDGGELLALPLVRLDSGAHVCDMVKEGE